MRHGLPKLLVLASTYPRWEGDHEPGFVHELSRRLVNDFEVHVLSPHALGAKTLEHLDAVHVHRFRYAPARFESLVQGGGIVNNLRHHAWKWLLVPLFMAGLTWNAGRLIRTLKPNVIHAHWIVPQGLALVCAGWLFRRLPPFLLTSHGGDLFGLTGTWLAQLKRWVIRRADAVTIVSRPMSPLAIALGADPKRLAILPMGVDFNGLFTPGNPAMRRQAEILFVGRLVEKKGLKYLIQAMPIILHQFPDARLIIAGYGPEDMELRALANRLGMLEQVSFVGAVAQKDLPDYYRRASVFVAPFVQTASGDQEGLPVAMMEAIACACPVVTGDLDVLSDVFEPSEADMRVDAEDASALAEKVISVLSHPEKARRRAEQMRTRLRRRLDWDAIARQYAGILSKLSARLQTGSG